MSAPGAYPIGSRRLGWARCRWAAFRLGRTDSGMAASGEEGVESRRRLNFGPLTTSEPNRSLQAGPLVPEAVIEAVITESGSERAWRGLFSDLRQIGRDENVHCGNGLWERHLRISRCFGSRRQIRPAERLGSSVLVPLAVNLGTILVGSPFDADLEISSRLGPRARG